MPFCHILKDPILTLPPGQFSVLMRLLVDFTSVSRLALNICSPGLIDIQINGAYGFDFSVYDGDNAAYRRGLKLVAEKIVETGVTA
jgi:N-acetylglucosamine-6-phosphate deacetylase